MQVRILPAARERLLGIWEYTADTWGEEQADKYVEGLVAALNDLMKNRDLWRSAKEKRFSGVFYSRYRHHYIFFKSLTDDSLGVITILHESMDVPNRLKDDMDDTIKS
jgi:toxin ParE1/3/4